MSDKKLYSCIQAQVRVRDEFSTANLNMLIKPMSANHKPSIEAEKHRYSISLH